MPYRAPWAMRFFSKLVLDVLPAALASVIGGFLFTQYQFGHGASQQVPAEHAAPASTEMMQLVRDEHALILDFLHAQIAAEKRKLAQEQQQTRLAEASPPASPALHHPAGPAVHAASTRRFTPRSVASQVHAPLVIARVQRDEDSEPSAHDQNSLLARTAQFKDRLLAVTHGVVAAIGGIPSWLASLGDRARGAGANSPPSSHLMSAVW